MDLWAKAFGYEGDIYFTIATTLLILARLLGILMLVPFMGGKLVPAQVKTTTAVALTLVIFPIAKDNLAQNLPNMGPLFTVYIMKEIFVGVMIGFTASLLFQALETAGQYLDTARGSSMANVLIPQLEESGPIFAQLKVQLGIVLFLAMNGHHYFLRAVFQSFVTIPLDTFPSVGANSAGIEWLIRATADVLLIGMQIAVPALIAIFLVDVVMGIANRAAPQLNVFFLGMPIKAYLGIVFVLLALNYFTSILGNQFRLMLGDVNYVIRQFGVQT